jgi:triphosphatase
MSQEIEIKLVIEAPLIARLWLALSRFGHDKPVSRRLFSAYYDTPDCVLKNHGVALRLRREGQRWIQTLKSAGKVTGGLHERTEHETEVPVQLPSFPAVKEAGFGRLIADRQMREALNVVFTTQFTRGTTSIQREDGARIEVCVDRGVIAAGERREPICEIELELKTGPIDALFDFAIALTQDLPLRLESRSKAERGYALAAGTTPAPVKAWAPVLSPDMSAQSGCANVMLACVAHLQANEAGLLAGSDPEYLHQARVALRRLRSAYRVFGSLSNDGPLAQAMEEVRALAKVLGKARNLDVFAMETLAPAGARDHAGMAAVHRRTQALRRRASRAAREAVAAPAYTNMLLRLTRTLSVLQTSALETMALQQSALGTLAQGGTNTPAKPTLKDFAAGFLARQESRVRKRGRKIARLGPEQLHRLRIQVKRLRYATEFFLSLAEMQKGGNDLQAETTLQKLLGRLNDDAMAWAVLDRLALAERSAQYQQAVGYLRGWCARDAVQCHGLVESAWKKFLERESLTIR